MTTVTDDAVAELGDALDEIFRLRRALAYEAAVLHESLDYRTFPKSRRAVSEDSEHRMILAALGDSELAYANTPSRSLSHAVRTIRGKQTLVRGSWKEGRDTGGAG